VAAASRKLAAHWGAVTAFPTGNIAAGDTCIRTDVSNAVFRYSGAVWRQAELTSVADAAARIALPSAALHAGFEVLETATLRRWQWTGSAWGFVGGKRPVAFLTQTTAQSSLAAATWVSIVLDSEALDADAAHGVGSTYTAPFAGDYKVSGIVQTSSGGAERNARIVKNGAVFRGCSGTGVGNQPTSGVVVGASTGEKILTLAAGDTLELQGYSNATWATFVFSDGGSSMTVEFLG
jgi:hypothetical protein